MPPPHPLRGTLQPLGEGGLLNPSNAELNPICHLLVLLEVHHILHVSRIGVKDRTVHRTSCQWNVR
jgi:hypothetical protein